MDKTKKDITKRAFISVMMTIFLVEITIQATSFVQGLFIGTYLNTDEFSTYGLAANYINFQYIIGSMFAAGTQITLATFLSKGKKKEAQGAFLISIITVIIISIIVIILVYIFSEEICIIFGARDAAAYLLPNVQAYLKLIVLSTPAYCLSFVLPQVALLQGGHKYVYCSYAVMLILTFIGCIINFNVLQAGLNGLGIIYSVNYYIAVLILCIHFLNKNNTFNFQPKSLKIKLLIPVLKQALPDMTLGICLLIFPIVLNSFILQYDQAVDGLAAFSMQMNFRNFIATISTGLCTSVLVLFGIYSTQKDFKECKKVLKCAFKMFVIVIIPISIIVGACSPFIANVYTQNETTLEFAKISIFWVAIYLPFFSIFRVCVKILQAIKHNVSPIILNILGYLVLPILVAYVLSNNLGMVGVLVALPVAQIIQCILSVLALLLDKLFHSKQNEISFIACMNSKNYPSFAIHSSTKDKAKQLMDELLNFLKLNGINDYTAKRILICLEESVTCILKYQSELDKKRNTVDVKIIIDDDEIILRIRDNYPKYMSKKSLKDDIDIDVYNIDENYRQYASASILWNATAAIEHDYIINFNNYIFIFHNIDSSGVCYEDMRTLK